jgi:DNA processing protein
MPITCSDTELRAWLRLTLEPDLTAAQARTLLAAFGPPDAIESLSVGQLAKVLPATLAAQLKAAPSPAVQSSIDNTLRWLDQPAHYVLTLADALYPAQLLDIGDPPLLLYVNGNPRLLSEPAIAVVGARSATVAGTDNASAFAAHLADQGWTIVSGLAEGIDAAAHHGALAARDGKGTTVAVMATGIDIVYPSRNRVLAHQIAAQGALLTEFPLGMRALPYHFPKRNRLVAGLSRGVLVVEAALKSGSLITARLATEMGREVFAIPGSIHSPLSRGCHSLIRQGAKLVESGQDIHDELKQPGLISDLVASKTHTKRRSTGKSRAASASTLAQTNLLNAMGHELVGLDALSHRTGLAINDLNTLLLELELAGLVAREDDGRFQQRPTAEGLSG